MPVHPENNSVFAKAKIPLLMLTSELDAFKRGMRTQFLPMARKWAQILILAAKRNKKAPLLRCFFIWRREWDSNP